MSRSPGARRRLAVRPTATVRRVRQTADGKPLPWAVTKDVRLKSNVVKELRHTLFWVSAQIVEPPLGPLMLPTGPAMVRTPGDTIGKIVDRDGHIGYCHFKDRDATQERERLAMIEGDSK